MTRSLAAALPRLAAPVPWQPGLRPEAAVFPPDERLPGIYVHIPFCPYKCSFCGFEARVSRGERHARFVAALRREIAQAAELYRRRSFDSIHFGGGTPSLLEADQLAAIVDDLRRAFDIRPGEVGLEAEPTTVDRAKLEALVRAGFTRVSFGVQSFSDAELHWLGRKHTPGSARAAVAAAREAGFPHVSIDLMFGFPGQAPETWRDNLDAAIALEVPHLSCYALSIEEHTVFQHRSRQGRLELPPDEEGRDHMEAAMDHLGEAGFLQYEVANFARPGHHSRHNLKYWCRLPYLGLGSGAHGFLDGVRWANRGEPDPYMAAVERGAAPRASEAAVTPEGAREESVFLELRKVTGMPLAGFREAHGLAFEDAFPAGLQRVQDLDLLYVGADRLCLTRKGMLLSDSLFETLLC